METVVLEWSHLLLRWAHVIAGILWIGDSFLFMWMDRSLEPPSRPRPGAVVGELWMVHSGGFYEVVKRRSLLPEELPARLHWFMWEAYSTWITGAFLFGVVYFAGGGVFLVEPGARTLGLGPAIALCVATPVAAWLAYDALWRSPLARRPRLLALICYLLIGLLAFGLTRVLSGRAAFLLVGATLGTLMVANVWRVIVPGQARMLEATRAGRPVDVTHGERAKRRSIHNHYLTLPVVALMISPHFPSTWGHPLGWVVLLLLVAFGAAVKHLMSYRARTHPAVLAAGAGALIALVAMTARPAGPGAAAEAYRGAAPVSWSAAREILERRCASCHATRPAHPSFPQPAGGVVLEDPRRVRALSDRILARAVVTRTMPLGNLTGMTDEERARLGAWIAQGAPIDAPR